MDAIALVGISAALRTKLLALEQQPDDLENTLRLADVGPMALAPRLIDRWTRMIDDMENLASRPGAWVEDIAEAREWLGNRISVRLLPDHGTLVAQVSLRALAGSGL